MGSSARDRRRNGAHQEELTLSLRAQRYTKKPRQNPRKEKNPSFREMVRRAHQRIIGAMHKRGNGVIYADNPSQAIATLKRWVRNTDGRIGKGKQVYGVLKVAFGELQCAHVITRRAYGFRLNPHTVIPA